MGYYAEVMKASFMKNIIVFFVFFVFFGLFCSVCLGGDEADKKVTAQRRSGHPLVGLALSGGGARGLAHVGVLKELEKRRIPIDFITGTSMGAIVGGFYAAGLSPDEIEEVMLAINWEDLLDDNTNRRDLSFRRKGEERRYMLDLELGFSGKHVIAPTGLSAGQKLSTLLSSTLLRVAGINDFDALPIPYRAVATDLATGDEVVLAGGDLAEAMRASMAVPGVFSPIVIDGRLLSDGGLANNMPVEVLKEMGADIVIAVDVTPPLRQSDELRTMLDVTVQWISMAMLPNLRHQRDMADVLILPNLDNYGGGDFHKVVGIIDAGVKAVERSSDALTDFAVAPSVYDEISKGVRRSGGQELMVGDISIVGNDAVDLRIIESRVKSRPHMLLDLKMMERDIARIFGMNDFSRVTCSGTPSAEGETDIKISVEEKRWGPGYLRFGLHLSGDFKDDTDFAFLVNYTRRNLNALGAEWSTEAQIGNTQRMRIGYYQPLTYSGHFFVSTYGDYFSCIMDVYEDQSSIAQYRMESLMAHLDAGVALGSFGEIKVGLYRGSLSVARKVGDPSLPHDENADVGGWRAQLAIDQYDDIMITRNGFGLDMQIYGSRSELGISDTYTKFQGATGFFKSYKRHTFFVRAEGGCPVNSELPYYDQFEVGGLFTFPGYTDGQLGGEHYALVMPGYHYKLFSLSPAIGGGVYLGGWGAVGDVWNSDDKLRTDDLIYCGAFGVAIDTRIGPVIIALGQAEEGRNSLYFSLGNTF